MLIKAFFMLVLLTQFGLNGQAQTPFDPTTDDGTSGTGTGGTGGTGGSGGTGGGGGTYPGGTGGRNDVPLDGGLSLLLAAGVGYGSRQIRKKMKTKSH